MILKLITTAFVFLIAIPVFAHTAKVTTGDARPALHLMSDSEFATFLNSLDANLLRSQAQLKNMDVKSVSLDPQESGELAKSYNRCLHSLDNVRAGIQKLSQKQTLRDDVFLLIDLNELARNLDALDQGLLNPLAVNGRGGAQKLLGYAKETLGIDVAVAAETSTFQRHFLAFAGVIDAALAEAEYNESASQAQR